LAEFVVAFGWDGRALAAGVGAGVEGAGLLTEVQEVVDGVNGDAEEAGDLGDGTDAAVDGVDDAVAEFKGVGVHAGSHRGLVRRIRTAILIIGHQTDS
jgi:hypothetical protein